MGGLVAFVVVLAGVLVVVLAANATALVHARVDLKTAQTRLGHSDPRLTIGVYAQATSEADRAAADVLGDTVSRRPRRRPRDGRAMDSA